MPILIALLVATATVAGVLTLVARQRGATDPADVRTGAEALVKEAYRHPRLHRFLADRRDTTKATGLLLTLTLGLLTVATLVVGLVLQMVQQREGFARWDDAAARWGAAHTTGATETILRVITQLGGTPAVVLVCVVVVVVERRRIPGRAAAAFLATVAVAQLALANIIKVTVRRDRPDIARLVSASGFSFPSGHTTACAAVYTAIALVIGRRRSRAAKAALAGAAGGITVAVATSRVLLGAHWLTDVIAGAALGWACFAVCSIAFGGRLLQFGAPVELAGAALATEAVPDTAHPSAHRPPRPRSQP